MPCFGASLEFGCFAALSSGRLSFVLSLVQEDVRPIELRAHLSVEDVWARVSRIEDPFPYSGKANHTFSVCVCV